MPYRRKHQKRAAVKRVKKYFRKRRTTRKRRVANQSYNRVNNTLRSKTVQGRSGRTTLKSRVSALETGSKKHHDFKQIRPQPILSYGVATEPDGQFLIAPSNLGMLRIPPKNIAGEIQNGSSVSEQQVRNGDTTFIRSCRIQFMLETYKPAPLLTDASQNQLVQLMSQKDWHCRVVFSIVRDRFPALPTGQSTSEPNPHSIQPGERPLEQIFERAGYFDAADNNTMITSDFSAGGGGNTNYGQDLALKSYDGPNRYKIIHQETIVLNSLTPRKLVKHTLVINRSARYMESPQQEGSPELPSDPTNMGYLGFLTTQQSINPLDMDNGIPHEALAMLSAPSVSCLSTRCYFTDT